MGTDEPSGGKAAVASPVCHYCGSELGIGARFCLECKQFQGLFDRIIGGLNLGALVALVPVATLAYAYLNETIVRPYSEVKAETSRCTSEEAILAVSNSGTRAAIVETGAARSSGGRDFDRALRPPGEGADPVVVKPGESRVLRMSLASGADLLPLPAAALPNGNDCRFDVSLSVLEFGGRRVSVPAGGCTC